jgi:hypothetical protein
MSRNPTLSMPGGRGNGTPIEPPACRYLLGEMMLIRRGAAYERAIEWHSQRPLYEEDAPISQAFGGPSLKSGYAQTQATRPLAVSPRRGGRELLWTWRLP